VLALHAPEDHVAVVVRNQALRLCMQRILRAEAAAAPRFEAWLRRQNASGGEIFLGMNPLKDGSKGRTKEHIREIRHAYLDLDEDGDASLAALRSSSDVPAPNFVLDTSPGKHQVVWRVGGLDQDRAEALLRALASRFGGDPAATDITRVLRLPGFTNNKYPQPFLVRASQETDVVYSPRDFRIPDGAPAWPRPFEADGARRLAASHRSQSEADWAYARRALARGDKPEEVVERIASYRPDKSDPVYYARLTVDKALSSLGPEAVEELRLQDPPR
jgi:RepB DNA-primase from phage plasmid